MTLEGDVVARVTRETKVLGNLGHGRRYGRVDVGVAPSRVVEVTNA